MKYNIQWLLEKHQQEERLKYLFFWGHTPAKDGSINKSCLSQWWQSSFTVEGIEYQSTEHYMMAGKAKLFNDTEMLEEILQSQSPAEAKKLGRKVKGFTEKEWLANRYEIVKQGNLHKFSQDEELKNFLKNTQNRILVEASPYDNIWGIGLTKDAKNVENPETWRGLNLLGFALMEVRDEL